MLKLTFSFAFAVLCFLLLLVFFSGLPDLSICRLPGPSRKNEPDRQNRLAVLLLTLVYAVLAFWHLGNRESPQTFVPMAGQSVVLALPENALPTQLALFPGVGEGSYNIEYSDDADGWYPLTSFTQNHTAVLKWQFVSLELPRSFRFLRIYCAWGSPWLGEVLLRDAAWMPIAAGCSVPELTDESELVPYLSDYMNSSYFDEIYHVRTAWEQMHGIWPYELSHPPLGKELISLGIRLFGMTPFGWRFSGTVTGILMLPLMYLFLKRLFGPGKTPLLGTILLASGFLHYAQTRIATIDSYAVFFILLMYYFMLGWLREGRLRDLALCGIAFGIGAACKWICLYAGAGLLVLWLGHWILEFKAAKSKEQSAIDRLSDPAMNRTVPTANRIFRSPICRFFLSALFCAVFFVLIPGLIYYLSYYHYGVSQNAPLFSRNYTKLVLDNQSFMFSYHANIVADHPYSSRWYQWILDTRPILYYLVHYTDGTRVCIGALVNPLICWGGLLSLMILLYTAIARRDRTAAFLLVAYASGLIPWFFISRITFVYHYFTSATFLIPAICYCFAIMERTGRRHMPYAIGFTAFSVFLFVWFFPVLNGISLPSVPAKKLLSWLPTWPF